MKSHALKFVLVMAATCTLAGCSESPEPRPTNTSTVAAPVTTAGTAVASSPAQTTASVPSPATTGPSSSPPPTDETASPRTTGPLTLSNFFNPNVGWVEGRYAIADSQPVAGIKSLVDSCSIADPVHLDLRLANNYQKLSFSVGLANDSVSADQTLIVRVKGNNQQIEVRPVPFNAHQEFDIPVAGVNATTIELHLDNNVPNCGGRVNAVLYDIELH